MHHVPFDPDCEPKKTGRGWLLASAVAVLAWTGAVGYGAYAHFGPAGLAKLSVEELAGLAALAIGPSLLLLFAGLAARELARAHAKSQHVVDIAGRLRLHAAQDGAQTAAEASRALRGEIVALDTVVRAAGQRIDRFRAALQQDGGALAHALKADIEAMRAVRAELSAEGHALTGIVSHNVAQMRQASANMNEQIDAFGATFAQIGARSAEFALAAEAGKTSTEVFDRAVHKALHGLAHATSLNECARKSVLDSAAFASEAARALNETTARAVEQARQAARDIRAGAPPATPTQALAESFTGRHDPKNIDPTPPRLSSVIDMFRLKPVTTKAKPSPAAAPLAEAVPANDREPPRATLADIVRLAGLKPGHALSPQDLARIARAGQAGPAARRKATMVPAAEPVRKISNHLRRNDQARRAAEILRREPARALGDNMDAARRLALTNAYLLVDAALG